MEAIVLGCTHYVFLKKAIQPFFPDPPLIDGNLGTVRQLARRMAEKGLLAPDGERGSVQLLSSGGPEAAAKMDMLLHMKE